MNKAFLLPKLAITGIRRNKMVYLPYLLTTSFSICVYFIFCCIIQNDILKTVPYANYVLMLLIIGQSLLGFILFPFLFYTNSFLIKRRKKEIGLYSILGLEKKHIGFLLFLETFFLFIVSLFIGLITAIVFAKLVFLLLLNISNLPVETTFTITPSCFSNTFSFFAVVFLFNLATNLFQVGTSNPAQLLQSSKKGEKEAKHILLTSIVGVFFLVFGYYLSITSEMGSMIFISFFFAVLFVIIGTYLLFTSGSILFLRILKKNKKFYYRQSNYITISGMLYRMKKNAASLSNICIFSTMIIITVLCTLSLALGEKDAIRFNYPYDFAYTYDSASFQDIASYETNLKQLAADHSIMLDENFHLPYYSMSVFKRENTFAFDARPGFPDDKFTFRILSLEDYNRLENKSEILQDNEVLLFSTTEDFAFETVTLNNSSYKIKSELDSFCLDSKSEHSFANRSFYLITKTPAIAQKIARDMYQASITPAFASRFNITGPSKNQQAFADAFDSYASTLPGLIRGENIIDGTRMTNAMNGGLLFIGVFFGLIFMICLLLIMYYKQISEGLEDKENYRIMQQVGMSDQDVKAAIHKQIKLVFFIPLIAAILHTFISLNLTMNLLYALNLFNSMLIIICTSAVVLFFSGFYIISYLMTAKTYYKLVKQEN